MVESKVCDQCGCLVGDTGKHEAWHRDAIEGTVAAALRKKDQKGRLDALGQQ